MLTAATGVLVTVSVYTVAKFLLALRRHENEEAAWILHIEDIAKQEEQIARQKKIEETEHAVLSRRSIEKWNHKYCKICRYRQRTSEEIAQSMLTCVQYGHQPTLSGRCDNCGMRVTSE